MALHENGTNASFCGSKTDVQYGTYSIIFNILNDKRQTFEYRLCCTYLYCYRATSAMKCMTNKMSLYNKNVFDLCLAFHIIWSNMATVFKRQRVKQLNNITHWISKNKSTIKKCSLKYLFSLLKLRPSALNKNKIINQPTKAFAKLTRMKLMYQY